jgi:diguanylate cyclase (GGDEF)-like protein/PAS domain S-box-containing protein
VSGIDSRDFRRVVEAWPEGIVLVDARRPDMPVVYVNPGYEALTGYTARELVGRNLRFLQAEDRDQDARHRLREQLERGEPCQVLLRNYRKDGTLFWNDMTIQPLKGADGALEHFVGYHRDAGDRLRQDPRLTRDAEVRSPLAHAAAPRDDRLTGLFTLPYLEELLRRDWAIAQRERRSIAVFAIDIDALDLYNTTFGRAAGDSSIRRVAHCVAACLRRASDVTARSTGGSLTAFAPGISLEHARGLGAIMAERVRELRIHHPRSTVLRYMSISVGVAVAIPEPDQVPLDRLVAARRQLDLAKKAGRNQAA